MTLDTVDSGQDVQEPEVPSQDKPASQQTDVSNGNSLSGTELVQAALNDPVAKEELRKQFQSDKDRGVAQANKTAQEANEKVDKLTAYLDDDTRAKLAQARRNMAIDQIVEQNSQGVASEAAPAETQLSATVDLDLAFTKAGFDVTKISPEDMAFAKQFTDQVALKNALIERMSDSRGNTTTPTGATAVPPSGKAPQKDVNVEEAGDELKALQDSKSRTERTLAEQERADELLQIINEAD